MRLFISFVGAVLIVGSAAAKSPVNQLWEELKAKREALPGVHQEFEVSRTTKTTFGARTNVQTVVLDLAQARWHERMVTGAGTRIRICDGKDVFLMEEDGEEYIRLKPRYKMEVTDASAYALPPDPDWAKAVEVKRAPCGTPGVDHQCVVMDVPSKMLIHAIAPGKIITELGGTSRMVFDLETGLLLTSRRAGSREGPHSDVQTDIVYMMKRMSYGTAPDAALLQLPSGNLREVKTLTPWTAAKLRKRVVGQPAPELEGTDLSGAPVSLSRLKGKTVLLDFWTTWCPPCRADLPSLNKLHDRYSAKGLEILGISVGEERSVVEKFLSEHSHSFPTVLTAENEMPRPYQVAGFPTYIVISPDGTVAAVSEGDQGFGDLRKTLQKAGLDTE